MPTRTARLSATWSSSSATFCEQGQARTHRHLGRALVRLRITEVHDEPVAQVLRDVTAELLDGPLTGRLVALHQPAEVLRVETGGERHGIDEVAEQDRDLSPLTLDARRPRPDVRALVGVRRIRRRSERRAGSLARTHDTPSIAALSSQSPDSTTRSGAGAVTGHDCPDVANPVGRLWSSRRGREDRVGGSRG